MHLVTCCTGLPTSIQHHRQFAFNYSKQDIHRHTDTISSWTRCELWDSEIMILFSSPVQCHGNTINQLTALQRSTDAWALSSITACSPKRCRLQVTKILRYAMTSPGTRGDRVVALHTSDETVTHMLRNVSLRSQSRLFSAWSLSNRQQPRLTDHPRSVSHGSSPNSNMLRN